jgi:membrane peptidoglycan carboxypeptidase
MAVRSAAMRWLLRNDFMRGYRLVAIAARMRHPSHLRLRSFGRHMTEIALAIRISREWTTDDIADTLLAESFYGRCSIGIEHASQACFGRPAAQLQPQESLALIALSKGPSGYDLDRNPERFRKRYAQLAEKLGHRGPDWSADAALARLTPATCTGTSLRRTGRAGQRA